MARKNIIHLGLMFIVILGNSGCATNRATSTIDPTADLSRIKTIFVVEHEGDARETNLLIVNKLKDIKFQANTGFDVPSNVDVIATYKDKWMWDFSMYMLELTITIRDPETNFPLASGNSYHTSLTRRSPEEMVEEVIGNIFIQEEKR